MLSISSIEENEIEDNNEHNNHNNHNNIPSFFNILDRLGSMALFYMILQTGEFYFYNNLPEQYQSVKGFNIPISLWLLTNGILGIQTAIFFIIYQWYSVLTIVIVPHLMFSVFLFLIFGIAWTITGWSCMYNIQISIKNSNVFEWYMFLKLTLQTLLYMIGYCVFFPCENYEN